MSISQHIPELHLVPPIVKPLTRPEIARGYSQAYLAVRALPSNYMPPDHYDYLQRVIAYLAYRYNTVLMRGTQFMPKPWVSMERDCEECEGIGVIVTRGMESDHMNEDRCEFCKGKSFIGGRMDLRQTI